MKRYLIALILIGLFFVSMICFAFNLYVGQPKSEVIAVLGQPNYLDVNVDQENGKIERCQWGSERVGAMLVIWFKDGKVLSFQSKGKLN
jgi:hypothetical protein